MIRSPAQRQTSGGARRGVPVVLSIAGSDSSGGAGLQADLKTCTTLGVHGASAVTCVVAEHPGRVVEITPLAPRRVAAQIAAVLKAFPVAAIKTGMLHSPGIIRAVMQAIAPALRAGVPLVVDPVMTASAGKKLMRAGTMRALRSLLARATVITPNRDELATLTGRRIGTPAQLEQAARQLALELKGPQVLAKGGHFSGREAVDLLVGPEGKLRSYRARRIPGADPHGTGCTYSAAIAAGLAKGMPLPQAVAFGKRFITRAIQSRWKIGRHEVLNSFSQSKDRSS